MEWKDLTKINYFYSNVKRHGAIDGMKSGGWYELYSYSRRNYHQLHILPPNFAEVNKEVKKPIHLI